MKGVRIIRRAQPPPAEQVDQRHLWAQAKVGDVLPAHGAWSCGQAETTLWLVCTRAKGHAGQHVATADASVLAVWPGEQL